MAALAEQCCGMGLLKIAGAYLAPKGCARRWPARACASDARSKRPLIGPVARHAAAGTGRKAPVICASPPAAKAATSSCRTCSQAMPPWRRRASVKPFQAVAHDPVNALDPGRVRRISTIWSATVEGSRLLQLCDLPISRLLDSVRGTLTSGLGGGPYGIRGRNDLFGILDELPAGDETDT